MKIVGDVMQEKELIKEKLSTILDKSMTYECQLVGLLWKDPELYFEYYSLAKNLIKSKVWKFYLEIGNKMVSNNYKSLDEISVNVFLDKLEKDKKIFEELGGYNQIEPIIETVKKDNLDVFIGELKKYSLLYNFIKDLTITEERLSKLIELDNVDDILSLLEIKFSNMSAYVENDDETENIGLLNEGIEQMIDEADKGLFVGLPIIDSKILNDEVCGLTLGDMFLLCGQSGVGKSTMLQQIFLSSILIAKESCVIFLNEQDRKKWQKQILTLIINKHILNSSNRFFSSKRWIQGHFTNEEKEWIKKANDILQSYIDNNLIIIVEFKKFTTDRVIKLIKKYAKLGVKYFALDTFKISDDYDNKNTTWFTMQNDLRRINDLIKPSNLNLHMTITMQLEKPSILKRYLTRTDISMSKNTIDVATVVLLIRRLYNDEYTGRNHELKVKNKIGENSYTDIILDEKYQYNITFIDKNRNGTAQEFQIVSKQNLGTLKYEEIGITSIPFGT